MMTYVRGSKMSRVLRIEYLLALIAGLVLYHQLCSSRSYYNLWQNHRFYRREGERMVNTAEGWLSYGEIESRVFLPHGFAIDRDTVPVASLKFTTAPPTCQQIFSNWLVIAQNSSLAGPKKNIPDGLDSAYLINGLTRKGSRFLAEAFKSQPTTWDMVEEWAALPEDKLHTIANYRRSSMSVYHAVKYHSVKDQRGLVIGSLTPWVEAFAIKAGAAKLLTLDYQSVTVVGSDKVEFEHPWKFAENWQSHSEQFDFVISFSSIEHSGLGTYGDSMDPIGDIREVQKVACALKKGGLFFLGLPRGQDALYYNLHRVYGRIRLAMMMQGFEWVSTFSGDHAHPLTLGLDDFDPHENMEAGDQDLFVLRKL